VALESLDVVRIILVEDEGLYRDLVRIALAQHPKLQVVGAYGDAESALAEATALAPRVAILDIELPGGLNGVQLGLRLRRQLPDIGIVLLSNHRDPDFLSSLPAETIAGWSYLLKKSVGDINSLWRAIEGAAAGLVMLDPALVTDMEPRTNTAVGRLAPRQREILGLIAQGLSNAAIAERLTLSEKSVENQINLVYQNLGIQRAAGGIHPRVSAVLRYMQESRVTGGL
jgi:DNA-binding NarL/FixJ family response regulator